MGDSVAAGYLPFLHLWDLKSPFIFYLFGFVEWLFPKSLIAIRVFGMLAIYASALLLMSISNRAGFRNGFLIALGYILLSSLFGSLQGVMSEHLAVLFILPGILFFLKEKTLLNTFAGAFFLGLALLCKLNLAYGILFFLLYRMFLYWKIHSTASTIGWAAFLATSLLLPFLLVSIPFMANGEMQLFIDSTFLAPFAYGHGSGMSIIQKLGKTWWIIVAGISIAYFATKASSKEQRETVVLISLLLLGTILSFFLSGKVNGHYLIEVYPFFLLLIFGLLVKRQFKPSLIITTAVVLLISYEAWKEYSNVAKQISKQSTPFNGKSFEVIDELKRRGIADSSIFFADYHIGYWFLDKYPLTKSTTHPSNLARPYLFKFYGNHRTSSLEELRYIMEEIRPHIIVSRKPFIRFLPEGGEENMYFDTLTKREYELIVTDAEGRKYVWQRKL